jgi:hypothetical protein
MSSSPLWMRGEGAVMSGWVDVEELASRQDVETSIEETRR